MVAFGLTHPRTTRTPGTPWSDGTLWDPTPDPGMATQPSRLPIVICWGVMSNITVDTPVTS
jgi:hypothetical protein